MYVPYKEVADGLEVIRLQKLTELDILSLLKDSKSHGCLIFYPESMVAAMLDASLIIKGVDEDDLYSMVYDTKGRTPGEIQKVMSEHYQVSSGVGPIIRKNPLVAGAIRKSGKNFLYNEVERAVRVFKYPSGEEYYFVYQNRDIDVIEAFKGVFHRTVEVDDVIVRISDALESTLATSLKLTLDFGQYALGSGITFLANDPGEDEVSDLAIEKEFEDVDRDSLIDLKQSFALAAPELPRQMKSVATHVDKTITEVSYMAAASVGGFYSRYDKSEPSFIHRAKSVAFFALNPIP
jgi:hypothetical protein